MQLWLLNTIQFSMNIPHSVADFSATEPDVKIHGGVLLSHTVAHAVSSGLRVLTAVFGMGTGVSPSLKSP